MLVESSAWQELRPSLQGHCQYEKRCREEASWPHSPTPPCLQASLCWTQIETRGKGSAQKSTGTFGHRAEWRKEDSVWTERSKGKMPGTEPLQKLSQGASNLHHHPRQMPSTCKLLWRFCHTHQWKHLIVLVSAERTWLCPGKYFKNKITSVLISIYWTPIPWKTEYFTSAFVVKVWVTFMVNLTGLLLRDAFTGFTEAPVAIFFPKRSQNKHITEKKTISDF